MAPAKTDIAAVVLIFCFQAILIVLFSIFVKYSEITPGVSIDEGLEYPLFQDIHVMIFVGFGFLMTFLRRYAFSALGFTFLVSSLVIQWSILCHGFLNMNSENVRIYIDMTSLINADISAAVILISFGAVIGKVTTIQLILMAVIETAFFVGNEYIGSEYLKAIDVGGSMYVHVFGAYFGLAVSFIIRKTVMSDENSRALEESSYLSDVTAMIGTLFLWLFWPSFNAGFLGGDEKSRAIINTYLSLTACCLTAFATSAAVDKDLKFDMVHIQNATLAGGVAIGTSANMMVKPYGALLIGSWAGILSTIGFKYVQESMLKTLKIHDTCGVHNLHGLPGILAGLCGAIIAALADKETYGLGLYQVFPALGPDTNRTPIEQAGYQFLALVMTFFVSIGSGLLTGLCIMSFKRYDSLFDDSMIWKVPEQTA